MEPKYFKINTFSAFKNVQILFRLLCSFNFEFVFSLTVYPPIQLYMCINLGYVLGTPGERSTRFLFVIVNPHASVNLPSPSVIVFIDLPVQRDKLQKEGRSVSMYQI